ncbi:histone deacetylase family protein [Amphibiibacter pelophylacis]|uniref:Histone deacetylase family protein n=1 Tax=Amphibiibacter pelophylacis TaxID=1799477 RepID=A0ACC6NXU3_9BURK
MLIFANPDHAAHCGRFEMFRGRQVPCHEVPARLDQVLAELERRRFCAPGGPAALREPLPLERALLERVHAPRYLDFLENAWGEWLALDPANAALDALPSVWPVRGFRSDIAPQNFAARMGLFSFDSGSPLTAGTWRAAWQGAACAASAAQALLGGPTEDRPTATLALTRPPGHHAGPDFFGGYCFINNAAVAAEALLAQGARRVAILDVDYHHGNGTQTIFEARADILTVSLHGDPRTEYPFYLGHADERGTGAGEGFNLNLPLPAGTGFDAWRRALHSGLQRVSDHGADAVIVALGVDTFAGDPISRFGLASQDYLTLGADLAGLGLPLLFTLEGGYAVADMGVNVVNVLEGVMIAVA